MCGWDHKKATPNGIGICTEISIERLPQNTVETYRLPLVTLITARSAFGVTGLRPRPFMIVELEPGLIIVTFREETRDDMEAVLTGTEDRAWPQCGTSQPK